MIDYSLTVVRNGMPDCAMAHGGKVVAVCDAAAWPTRCFLRRSGNWCAVDFLGTPGSFVRWFGDATTIGGHLCDGWHYGTVVGGQSTASSCGNLIVAVVDAGMASRLMMDEVFSGEARND